MHAPQVPLPLQTMLVPQAVPAALAVPSMQVIAPVAQDVVPFRQTPGLPVQALPAVQATQEPAPLQTWLGPQLVPAALLPPSMQVMRPVAQVVVPFRQTPGFVVQPRPTVQPPQMPLLHTRFVPQVVPFGRFPVSPQTGTPVTQEVAPVLQALVGWQPAPAVHGLQMPLLQTRFNPHEVPLARFLFVSEQVIAGAHACVPAWQGFAG